MNNHELISDRKLEKEIGVIIAVGFLALLLIAYEYDSLIFGVLLSVVYIVFASIYWFMYLLKPAAWVNGKVLSIKAWPLGRTTIALDRAEKIVYEPSHYIETKYGKKKVHKIKVKLPNHGIWEIPINDQIDHIKDMRLYRFIKVHFPDLVLNK